MCGSRYERAERARKAAGELAAAQNLDEVGALFALSLIPSYKLRSACGGQVGGKLTQTTSEAASMFGGVCVRARASQFCL